MVDKRSGGHHYHEIRYDCAILCCASWEKTGLIKEKGNLDDTFVCSAAMHGNLIGVIIMKRTRPFFLVLSLVCVFAISIFWHLDGPSIFSRDTIVFEMTYRGLNDLSGPHSPRLFSPFSQRGEPNSPFYQALKTQTEDLHPVRCPFLKGSEWAGYEMKAGKPSVFYMDLNTDGHVAQNEAFQGTPPPDTFPSEAVMFQTPDFSLRTVNGHDIPYRLSMMVVGPPDGPLDCYWAPFYVLEGRATIAEENVRLVLYPRKVNDDGTECERAHFSLSLDEEGSDKKPRRHVLGPLVRYDDEFYRLKIPGSSGQQRALKVMLEKDGRPKGRLKIYLDDTQGIKSLNYASRVRHTVDPKVCLDTQLDASEMPRDLWDLLFGTTCDAYVPAHQTPGETILPEGRYDIEAVLFHYGLSEPNEWKVLAQNIPTQTIRRDVTTEVTLVAPLLSVEVLSSDRAITSDKGVYHVDANDLISVTLQTKGPDGAVYSNFHYGESSEFRGVSATVHVVDDHGNQVVSTDMSYG